MHPIGPAIMRAMVMRAARLCADGEMDCCADRQAWFWPFWLGPMLTSWR